MRFYKKYGLCASHCWTETFAYRHCTVSTFYRYHFCFVKNCNGNAAYEPIKTCYAAAAGPWIPITLPVALELSHSGLKILSKLDRVPASSISACASVWQTHTCSCAVLSCVTPFYLWGDGGDKPKEKEKQAEDKQRRQRWLTQRLRDWFRTIWVLRKKKEIKVQLEDMEE